MAKNSENKSEKRQIGDLGESLACRFLENKGYKIVERNYLKPYGEIDIIAKKGKETVFIEVKSVTRPYRRGTSQAGTGNEADVTHETDSYRPEDNLHLWKLKRLTRAINSYLLENKIEEGDWRFDVVIVYLSPKTKKAEIKHIEGIVL